MATAEAETAAETGAEAEAEAEAAAAAAAAAATAAAAGAATAGGPVAPSSPLPDIDIAAPVRLQQLSIGIITPTSRSSRFQDSAVGTSDQCSSGASSGKA